MSFYMVKRLTLDIKKLSQNPEADIKGLTKALESLDGVKTVIFDPNGFRDKGLNLKNIIVGSYVIDTDNPGNIVTYIKSEGYEIVNNSVSNPRKINNL